jgi:hypothetical protein
MLTPTRSGTARRPPSGRTTARTWGPDLRGAAGEGRAGTAHAPGPGRLPRSRGSPLRGEGCVPPSRQGTEPDVAQASISDLRCRRALHASRAPDGARGARHLVPRPPQADGRVVATRGRSSITAAPLTHERHDRSTQASAPADQGSAPWHEPLTVDNEAADDLLDVVELAVPSGDGCRGRASPRRPRTRDTTGNTVCDRACTLRRRVTGPTVAGSHRMVACGARGRAC